MKVLKNRLQSMALNPGKRTGSGKDGLFPTLLRKDGAWLVLGIRVVGQLWGQEDTGLSRMACFSS